MKKKFFPLLFLIFALSLNPLICQPYMGCGFGLYNNYIENPAFIDAEKHCQIDLIGYHLGTESRMAQDGLLISTIGKIPKINSSLRVSYELFSLDFSGDNEFNVGYSYRQRITDDLSLTAGVGFLSFYTTNVVRWRQNELNAGLGLEYKDLVFGISGKSILNGEIESTSWENPDYVIHYSYKETNLFVNYRIGISENLSIVPQAGLCVHNDEIPIRNDDIQVGAIINYKDTWGLGYNFQSPNSSIFGICKLSENISILLLIYGNNNFLISQTIGANLLGQIRISF